MPHPQDQGRCVLDGYFECAAKIPEACICAKTPKELMTNEELRQTVESLHGHAKWLRNYRESPRTYHDPLPMVPNELDRIADRLNAMHPSEMIERIASVLEANFWREDEFSGTDADQRQKFYEVARAAIEAMREPTEPMNVVGESFGAA